jgi:signal-transduction protein with cAMP-binding, CBS, and nucleotidyltransferase domain
MSAPQNLPNISALELRSFSTFDNLCDTALEELSKVLIPMFLPKGGLFHKMGNKETYLFLLKNGCVDIHTEIDEEEEILLAKVEAYQIFGLSALLRQSTQALSFSAEEDTFLYVLPRHLHQWALERGIKWAIELQRILSIQLVQQMRCTLKNINSATKKTNISDTETLQKLLKMTELSIPNDEQETL